MFSEQIVEGRVTATDALVPLFCKTGLSKDTEFEFSSREDVPVDTEKSKIL